MTGIDDAILYIDEAKNTAIAACAEPCRSVAKARLFNDVNVQKEQVKMDRLFRSNPSKRKA